MAAVWVVTLVTRVPALDHSLWWDEAYTAVFYVERGPSAIFSADAFMVNNHVLFSLLTWPTAQWLGGSEPVLRLWSLLPALGSLALLTWWVWRRWGHWPSVAVGALIALSPLHQALSTQARGYGLVFLAAAMMLVGAVEAHHHARRRDFVLLGVGGVIATWTVLPTVLLLCLHAGLLVVRRATRRGALAVLALVAVADVAFYRGLIPLILRYSQGAGLREGIGTPWHAPVSVPVERMLEPLAGTLWPGAPRELVVGLGALLLAAAVLGLLRRAAAPLAAHTLGVVTLALLAMFAIGANIVDRYVSFLLLHVLVAVGVGITAGLRSSTALATRRQRSTAAAVVAAVAALVVAGVSTATALERLRLPREDYRRGAQVVAEADVETVLLNRTVGRVGFTYYLGHDVVEMIPPEQVADATCGRDEPFVLIDYPVPGSDDHGDLACVRDRATRVVEVEQGNERAPSYRVFVVGATDGDGS